MVMLEIMQKSFRRSVEAVQLDEGERILEFYAAINMTVAREYTIQDEENSPSHLVTESGSSKTQDYCLIRRGKTKG